MRWRRVPMYFDRPHRVRVDRCGGPADELLRCVNDALKKGLSIKCAYCYRVFFFSLDILSSRVVSSKELGRTWRGLSEMVFFFASSAAIRRCEWTVELRERDGVE